eukprot:140030-Chlamydomonas_euryale.AAC.1
MLQLFKHQVDLGGGRCLERRGGGRGPAEQGRKRGGGHGWARERARSRRQRGSSTFMMQSSPPHTE